MSKVLFTADFHLGHSNIIKYCHRPFLMERDQQALDERGGVWHRGTWKDKKASNWRITPEAVALMDATIIDNINKMVGVDDTLWFLGDFALPGKSQYVEKCEAYRRRIQCRDIRMIWGNHDGIRRNGVMDTSVIKHLFSKSEQLIPEAVIHHQTFFLCHYAPAVWNKSHRGAIALYGHSHTTAEPWMDKFMVGRKSIDVGVDNAYKILGEFRPFTFDEIIKIMSKREGFSMDHHIPKNSTAPEEVID